MITLTSATLLLFFVVLNSASAAPGRRSSHFDIDAMIDPLQPSSAEDVPPKESQLAQRSLFNFRVFCPEGEQNVNGRCVPVVLNKSAGGGGGGGTGGQQAAALQLAHSYYQQRKTTRKPSRRRPQGTGEVPTTTTTELPPTTTTTLPTTTTMTTPSELLIHHTAPTPTQFPVYQVVTSGSGSGSSSSSHHHHSVAPTTPEFVHELDIIQTNSPVPVMTTMTTPEEHVHHHHHSSSHHQPHHHQQQQPILTSPTPMFETTTPYPEEARPTSLPPSAQPSPSEVTNTPTLNPTIISRETDIEEDQVPETTMMPQLQSEISSDTQVFTTDSELQEPETSLPSIDDQGPEIMASTLPPSVLEQVLEEQQEPEAGQQESTMLPTELSEAVKAESPPPPIQAQPVEQQEPQVIAHQVQKDQPPTTPQPSAPSPTTQVFHVFPETTSEPSVPVHPASVQSSTPAAPPEVLSTSSTTTTSTSTPLPTTTQQPPKPSPSLSSIFRFPEESDDYIDQTSTEIHVHPAFQPTPSSSSSSSPTPATTSTPLASIFWEPIDAADQVLIPKPRSNFESPANPSSRPSSGFIHFDSDTRSPSDFKDPPQFQPADRRTQLSGVLAPALSDYPTYPSFTAHEHFRFPVSTINTAEVASTLAASSQAESQRRSRQFLRQFG